MQKAPCRPSPQDKLRWLFFAACFYITDAAWHVSICLCRGIEGEQEILTTILAYSPQAGSFPAPDAAAPLMQDEKKTDPRGITLSMSTDEGPTSNTWTVGVTHISRSELEKALAEGKRVSINVVGLCRFADDISADLADRAVEQLHLIGNLQASPEVREVLMKKRSG